MTDAIDSLSIAKDNKKLEIVKIRRTKSLFGLNENQIDETV